MDRFNWVVNYAQKAQQYYFGLSGDGADAGIDRCVVGRKAGV